MSEQRQLPLAFPRKLLGGGAALLLFCGGMGLITPTEFLHAYLVAFLFWAGVSFGALILLAVHHLVGGGWGFLIRRILEAATRTWPLVLILFVPVVIGMPWLYHWSDPEVMAHSHLLESKHLYLNVPGFLIRSAIFFAIFVFLAWQLNRTSYAQDSDGDPEILRRLHNISAPGLLFFVLALTFALIDWAMTLQPEWFSTMFSPMLMVGNVVCALAVAILALSMLSQQEALVPLLGRKYILDLGNLFFAFVVLWAYLQFSQYIITWSGNLTEEIPWYIARTRGGWESITLTLALLHFALPFALLLLRRNKRDLRPLARIAALVLFAQLLAHIWIVEPAFHPAGFFFLILDWLLPLAIGAFWVAWFVRELGRVPLVARADPRLPGILAKLHHTRVGDVSYES